MSSTDYEYYTVFGTNGVQIGHDSQIHGNVGAKHNRTASPSPHEALNWAGGADVFGEGRSGEDVAFATSTSLTGNLYYVGDLATQASTVIGGSINHVADPQLPAGDIPSQWPTSGPNGPASTYCAANHSPDINNANGTTINLTPGTWGDVHAGSTTTLNFNGAGDYFFDSLTVGSVSINLQPGTRLFFCHRFSTAHIITDAPAFPTYIEAQTGPDEFADGHGIEFSDGPWVGDIVVPHAGFHIGSGGSGDASVDGHIWAENVDLEHAIQVTTPSTTTTTTSSTSTSSTSTSSTSTSSTSTSSTSTSSTSTTAPTTTSTTAPTTTTTTTIPDTTTTSTTIENSTTTTSSSTTTTAPTTTTSTTAPTTTTSTTAPTTTTTTTIPGTTTTSTTIENETTTTSVPESTTTTSIENLGTTTTSVEGSTTTSIENQGTTSTTAASSSGSLPRTGGGGGLIPFALITLGAGLALVFSAKRRRAARSA